MMASQWYPRIGHDKPYITSIAFWQSECPQKQNGDTLWFTSHQEIVWWSSITRLLISCQLLKKVRLASRPAYCIHFVLFVMAPGSWPMAISFPVEVTLEVDVWSYDDNRMNIRKSRRGTVTRNRNRGPYPCNWQCFTTCTLILAQGEVVRLFCDLMSDLNKTCHDNHSVQQCVSVLHSNTSRTSWWKLDVKLAKLGESTSAWQVWSGMGRLKNFLGRGDLASGGTAL